MTTIVQIARFSAKPGKAAILGERLGALVSDTRRESGCIRYELFQDDNGRWAMFEMWAGPEAVEHHLVQPYISAFVEVMGDLVDGAPEVEALHPVTID